MVRGMALFGRKRQQAPLEEPAPLPTLPEPPSGGSTGLRSVPEHRDYILGLIEPLPAFGMRLLDAYDLALCEDLRADADLPIHDTARVNGYAVHVEDLTPTEGQRATLRLRHPGAVLKVGAAVPVQAGEALPEGADAVIPLHRADIIGEQLFVSAQVHPGDFVRARGSEMSDGQWLMRTGDRLTAGSAAVLSAAGYDRVLARPRPRVVVLNIGPAPAGKTDLLSEPGHLHEVNANLIATCLRSDEAVVWRVDLDSDDPRTIRDTINDQLIRADLVVASAEAGDQIGDLVCAAMAELGATDFAEVALAPGRHQGFGLIGEDKIPMLILPGDPVASFVSYQVIARPVLRRLMGTEPYSRQAVMAHAEEEIVSDPGVLELVLATVREDGEQRVVMPLGRPHQHTLLDIARADALVLLPPDKRVVRAGDPVMCWLLDRD